MDLHLRPWHLAGVLRDFAMHLNSMKDQAAENALYRQAVAGLAQPPAAELSDAQLLERMEALGRAGMRYWLQIMKIVQVIYRQEGAFTSFYERRLHRAHPGLPAAEIFLRGQKVKPWEAECSMFDLAQMAQQLGLAELVVEDAEQLLNGAEAGAAIHAWRAALAAHLNRFGHQLASFDLCLPTLADDPRPVLTAIRAYLKGKESPYVRQQRMAAEGDAAAAAARGCLSRYEADKFQQLLSSAQQAACAREDALFDVGLAWTHLHRLGLELGRRLVQRGALAQPEDIFWLYLDEIRTACAQTNQAAGLAAPAAARQAQNKTWTGAQPPYLLPLDSRPAFWWKWVFPTPELNRQPDAHTLVGLGVSPGKVTGVARVIRSLDEAQHIHAGEILVTRSTTPAWTPLFAQIGGLVTDLGGPLAHGSIVAREYGIPAVMGTGAATQRIKDGEVITVDGTAGRVSLN
jgi:pyruvate,water dikinase